MTRPLRDRDGQPFDGTAADLKRHNAKLRQRARRAKAPRHIELPVSGALDRAIAANMARGGFDDARELIELVQLNLARLDDDTFQRVTAVPRHDVSDVVARYAHLIHPTQPEN